MSSYTVRYFRLSGRAAVIREILNYAGANWENEFVTWPDDKPTTPYGRLPVLEETTPSGEKVILSESRVIESYLAKTFNLLPTEPRETAKLEMLVAQMDDSLNSVIFYSFKSKTEECKKDFEDKLKFLISKHETILASNPAGYYHGSSITYPDLAMYALYNIIAGLTGSELLSPENAPHINKLVKKVGEIPAIATANNFA
ncbi:hypothetical protein BB560_006135 [Smittium megazygosporum]|uniref:GST N-terminal domain-containing protein n=1 Tax=Smittium megazygosporum TaxID=133381 RepID=A0A2T9YG21_9FUNG|nr:hypothetical protein BB560_006135 [Smittium megazygosporum]